MDPERAQTEIEKAIRRFEELEGEVLFLQGLLHTVFNELSPPQKEAVRKFLNMRARPTAAGGRSTGYAQAAALFGREGRR